MHQLSIWWMRCSHCNESTRQKNWENQPLCTSLISKWSVNKILPKCSFVHWSENMCSSLVSIPPFLLLRFICKNLGPPNLSLRKIKLNVDLSLHHSLFWIQSLKTWAIKAQFVFRLEMRTRKIFTWALLALSCLEKGKKDHFVKEREKCSRSAFNLLVRFLQDYLK